LCFYFTYGALNLTLLIDWLIGWHHHMVKPSVEKQDMLSNFFFVFLAKCSY